MRAPEAVRWSEDRSAVDLLDQRLLPEREERLRLTSAEAVAVAIRDMAVRGAPAIGIAAAMGVAVEMAGSDAADRAAWLRRLDGVCDVLRGTRPTAVNLAWALARMRRRATAEPGGPEMLGEALRDEADAILEEDRAMCLRIGEHGAALLPDGAVRVLTHCNAGALATGGIGTALAPLYVAAERGRALHVYADETRPLLQGSRLTAWELKRAGVDVTVVADSVAATLLRDGRVDLVLVGADRIAANGDVANKIGTYGVAVLARHHGVPFYVAAPTSTLDVDTATGRDIPIEERDADEVRRGFGRLTAPVDVAVYSPAFDVTPAELVSAIITDRGVLRPPFTQAIHDLFAQREES
ncbi:MAG TPA: S-methyl-5-thioribose-1-phosphate isomerase [Longimicrobiales bacterium]|nr:S-methyl-5-thioribose-1-phosphate isomerase [Longimicrobiales bacterium]